MRLNAIRYVVLCLFVSLAMQMQGKKTESSFLNDRAVSFLWNNLDSAEYYAQKAVAASRTHSDGRAMAVNTLARIATIRMDFTNAWDLYNSVPDITDNTLEVVAAEIGLMRICQRTSDNVSFYEYRNSILLKLRALNEESQSLSAAHMERLLALEYSFRLESAWYWFELEQPEQAEREMSFLTDESRLIQDFDHYLLYSYMRGLGLGSDGLDDRAKLIQRLQSLDICLRGAVRTKNVRMQILSIGAVCSLMLEYGTESALQGMSGDMQARLDALEEDFRLLPCELAEKALSLAVSYGGLYEIIECERLLASCYFEMEMYTESLEVLQEALDLLNDNMRASVSSLLLDTIPLLESYRTDQIIVEKELMTLIPHAVVPEALAALREQMGLAYSGLDNKPASDYNRTVYLEIQKSIRLDRRYEARSLLLVRSNRRLIGMLYAVAVIMVVLTVFLLLFNRRIKVANSRYATLVERMVGICESILCPAPEGKEIIEWLNESVAVPLAELVKANFVTISPNAGIEVEWGRRHVDAESRMVVKTLTPYIAAALHNANELFDQEDRLREVEKQHYLYTLHASMNKRENMARKTCCQVVGECLPYIDRMRAQTALLARTPQESEQFAQSLDYVSELAERINSYNDLFAQWIRIRQGMVHLHVESFELQPLFDIVSHGNRSFLQKGLKLEVLRTDAVVRADRVLTLFMINTLADNARKFTPTGGTIKLTAVLNDDYVEIVVSDTGIGMNEKEVQRIREGKLLTADKRNPAKGSGFGIMNCKGIIEKYLKYDAMFSVCRFDVESEPGKGSRFSFRLPKGTRRILSMFALLLSTMGASSQSVEEMQDSLLLAAYMHAESAYTCNTEGRFEEALLYADSAFSDLNYDYLLSGGSPERMLSLFDTHDPAETLWLKEDYPTDYETILWLRNEIAVSALALRDWDAYRYNDNAYLILFKQYFGEQIIESDYRWLQRTNSNLNIAVLLFFVLLLVLLLILFVEYSRRWMMFRSDMQQALRVVNSIRAESSMPHTSHFEANDMLNQFVDGIFLEVSRLANISSLMITLDNDGRMLKAVHTQGVADERLADRMTVCLANGCEQSSADGLCRVVPLLLTLDGRERMIGAMGVRLKQEPSETWSVLKGMIARYVATTLYSSVIRFESKSRDIEQIKEESERIRFEENRLYVSNLILDNCLSTLKHETLWYPGRIVQMVQAIQATNNSSTGVYEQITDMQEIVDYYRELFSILCQYAMAQTSDQLIRKESMTVVNLMAHASAHVEKMRSKYGYTGTLNVQESALRVRGDSVLLEYLLENLLNKGMEQGGDMLLFANTNGFVRIALFRQCSAPEQELLDGLFTPLMNRNDMSYVICRQIIREHDEVFGYPGCRINAESVEGGITIWFTIPMVE